MDANMAGKEKLTAILSGSGQKSIPEVLSGMSNQALMEALYFIKSCPAAAQEMVLLDILKHAGNSQTGQKNSFYDIKDSNDFRSRLPITDYHHYASDIEAMASGLRDILFDGETVSFVATSGTTGIAKLIPESSPGTIVKALVSRARLLLMLNMAPEIMQPGRKVLSITNPAEYAKTEGGIPIGSASGQAVKDIPAEMLQKLLLPPELLLAKNLSNEAMDYLILLLSLAEEALAGVICSNIAHFSILLDKMNSLAEVLLEDIRQGKISSGIELDDSLREKITSRLVPNPERADRLKAGFEKEGRFDVQLAWPNFSVVSCWMTAGSARIVDDFRKRVPPETKFLEWGYGASEGKFNIPSVANDPSGDLALFGYFFEFLPLGGEKTLLAHELIQGEFYELVVTSYSGLYRYNMKDIVRVRSMDKGSPRIVFACKSTEVLRLDAMALYAFELDSDLQQAADRVQGAVRFYQVMADTENGKLVFVAEPADPAFPGQKFSSALEEILQERHGEYRRARTEKKLESCQVLIMGQGYRDKLFTRSIMPGKNVNQTKLKTIIESYPDEESIIDRFSGGAR